MKRISTRKLKDNKLAEIKKQIDDCLCYIKALAKGFDETADNNLINYYIYEKRAAEIKYYYLLGVYADMMKNAKLS